MILNFMEVINQTTVKKKKNDPAHIEAPGRIDHHFINIIIIIIILVYCSALTGLRTLAN